MAHMTKVGLAEVAGELVLLVEMETTLQAR